MLILSSNCFTCSHTCVCVYVRARVIADSIGTHAYTRLHTHRHTMACARMCAHTHTHTHTHTDTSLTSDQAWRFVPENQPIASTHTHTHTNTHTHTHTHYLRIYTNTYLGHRHYSAKLQHMYSEHMQLCISALEVICVGLGFRVWGLGFGV